MKERVSATKVYFVFTPFFFLIYFLFCVTLVLYYYSLLNIKIIKLFL
jgi:hypothetical protein